MYQQWAEAMSQRAVRKGCAVARVRSVFYGTVKSATTITEEDAAAVSKAAGITVSAGQQEVQFPRGLVRLSP
eukprot:7818210-Lingulodinium_polyedra.AAC.1